MKIKTFNIGDKVWVLGSTTYLLSPSRAYTRYRPLKGKINSFTVEVSKNHQMRGNPKPAKPVSVKAHYVIELDRRTVAAQKSRIVNVLDMDICSPKFEVVKKLADKFNSSLAVSSN